MTTFQVGLVFSALCLGSCSVAAPEPMESPSAPTIPVTVDVPVPSDTVFGDFDEPPVAPRGDGGLGEPLESEPDEIDCVDAEDLCDSGVYACDDIADYCDVGPDGLEELPDDYDWDGG